MYVLVDPFHMFLSDFKHVFVDVRHFLLLLTHIPVDFCACSFGLLNISISTNQRSGIVTHVVVVSAHIFVLYSLGDYPTL